MLHIVFASLSLTLPYLIPIIAARRLSADARLLVSIFLCFKALEDCVFLVPSYIIEYTMNPSDALYVNLQFVVFTNFIINILLALAINRGRKIAKKISEPSIWKQDQLIFKEAHILIFGIIFLIAYIVLTGFLAIKDPRLAYQSERAGIGFVWAGFISLSTMWVVIRIINHRPILLTFFVYSIFCVFSGSKGLLFAAFLPFLANPRASRRFRIKFLIVFLPIAFFGFLFLFGQLSAGEGLLIRLSMYFDMFHQSVRVFEDYLAHSFDFYFGKIYFSSLWQFVPRALYSEKPYAWGSTTLIERYYPGMAETGHTPSFGQYTTDFADFGYFGFLSAIFNFDFIILAYSLYVVSSGYRKNKKMYVLAYAVLIAPGIYFHLPLFIALPIFYFLMKFRRGSKAIISPRVAIIKDIENRGML